MIRTEERFRNKVTAVQFLLSVGIVYQHTVWNYRDNPILNAGQSFLFYLIETCVPFFFMISGYLFFRTYDHSKWKEKLLSRVRTLFIPYMVWNAVYTVFMVSLKRIGLITNLAFSNNLGGVILQLINSEFSPLWFIKYLMVFSLIAPIMYYVLRHRIVGALAIGIMIILNAWSFYSGIMQIPINVNANNLVMLNYQYIFYAVGAYGALNWKDVVERPSHRKCLAAMIVLAVLMLFYWGYAVKYGNAIISHSFRLIYIIALWFALDACSTFNIYGWMKNSFFLYCSHLMVLQSVQRVCDFIVERIGLIKPALYVAEYIFLPMAIIGALVVVANLMRKYMPRTYGVLTGSRG